MTDTDTAANVGMTHALRLVFDHDEQSYHAIRGEVRDALPHAQAEARRVWPDADRDHLDTDSLDGMRERHARGKIAEWLREFVESHLDEYLPADEQTTGAMVLRTLVLGGLGEVDWHAWAESLVEDLAEEDSP